MSRSFALSEAIARRCVAVLLAALVAAAVSLPSPVEAGDGFRAAKGKDRRALIRLAKRDGLRGRYAVITKRVGGTKFGVVCGRSGGSLGGMTPARKTGRKWRTYAPVSGGIQTYAAACEARR